MFKPKKLIKLWPGHRLLLDFIESVKYFAISVLCDPTANTFTSKGKELEFVQNGFFRHNFPPTLAFFRYFDATTARFFSQPLSSPETIANFPFVALSEAKGSHRPRRDSSLCSE